MKRIFILGFCFVQALLNAQDISLDTNYGTDGYTTFDSRSTDHATFSKLLNDGSLLVSSSRFNTTSNKQESVLIKYLLDGSIDASFADNGVYIIDHEDDNGVEVFTDASESIYLYANVINQKLFKLTSQGALDVSFGVNGELAVSNDSENFSPNDVTLVNDGIIVASSVNLNTDFISKIKKFDLDGNLDTSFGTNGEATSTIDIIRYVSSVSNNDFFISGRMADDTRKIIRYNSDGSITTSFANNGEILNSNTTIDNELIKQINNNIYVLLFFEDLDGAPSSKLFKYDLDGNIDTTFGDNGSIVFVSDYISSIINYNNSLYLSSIKIPEFSTNIYSYDFDGAVNTAFATNGVYTEDSGTFRRLATNLIQKDDTFYLTGSHRYSDADVKHFSAKYNLTFATASIEDTKTQNIAFENPVKDIVEVKATLSKINRLDIFALNGKLIKSSESNTIRTDELPSNVYILNSYLDNGNVVSNKIIKK
ncbi:T9SS type A sorting domain-containing protein [Tenacibaculum sp. M341]|uniref:T9SS type A sorting domain-containing protein n=1 Tax=Tenacibaculum sp. M341 TaxID=2530339 RepID=UPI00140558D8|nr:T9SS type A sorting domain-containing protein [Tenacibaculum sp. M341]